jgi:hypothetical protein
MRHALHIILAFTLLLVGCYSDPRQVELVDRAEALIDSLPEASLALLDSVNSRRLVGADNAAIEWYISAANPGSGSGKHTVYRPAAHAAGLASGQLAKDSSVYEISVRRNGKDTCYEFRIPWRDAGGVRPQAGTRLGLALRLTDADSGAARGAAAWGRGLESWAPSSFGSLVLLP